MEVDEEEVKVKLRLSALDQSAKAVVSLANYKTQLDLTIKGHKSCKW